MHLWISKMYLKLLHSFLELMNANSPPTLSTLGSVDTLSLNYSLK